MLKKIHNHVKTTVVHKTLTSIIKQPKLFLYMFLLDIAFFAVFLLLYYILVIIDNRMAGLAGWVTGYPDITLMIVSIMLVLLYIVIFALVYSFYKLIILGNVKSFSVRHRFDLSLFKSMFLLNLLLFFFFFLLVIIFVLVMGMLVNQNVWLVIVISIIFFIIGVMAYAFVNFAHSAFIMRHEFVHNLKSSLKHTVTRSYLGIFIFDMVAAAVYIAFYIIIGLVFKNWIIVNESLFLNVFTIITLLVAYLLFSFNRVYFFFTAEKFIGHKR